MFSVKDIYKSYGSKQVLNGVSLEARPGEFVSVVGGNGCGKSTLLKILAGGLKPDGGSIQIFGQDALKKRGVFSKFVGFVPQENPLLPDVSVKDQIAFFASAVKNPDYSLLQEYNLKDLQKTKVSALSGGMKRRLAIVCALIGNHPVLILDEPTSSLDLYYEESIMKALGRFRERNGIVICSTHNPDEILQSDVCFLFDSGTLVRYDKKDIDITTIKNAMQR